MFISNRNIAFSILGVLFLANLLVWNVVFDFSSKHFLEVNFFDVGQGDAIFIETPQRHQILIDGGPDSIILEKLSKEMPFWDRSIDLIILTHPEKDHLVGLLEVLKKYKVENILWTGVIRETAEYKEWKKLIAKEGAKIVLAKSDRRILLGSDPINRIEILYPFENLEGKVFKDSNNTSIINKLVFGENSFLFTGDAYKDVEGELLLNLVKQQLNSDILKIAHHGSKTSTSDEFLENVSPEYAIISVGKKKDLLPDCDNKERNIFGHPNCEVLERLKKFGINILRTDIDGDIKITSDGKNYEISNF